MNIALVANDLSGAGAQRVLVLLAQAWAERGHRVFILTTHEASDAHAIPAGVERVRLHEMTYETNDRAYEAARACYQETLDWTRLGAYLLEDEHVRRCVERLGAELGRCRADVVISFCGAASLVSVLARPAAGGPAIIVREGNDPRRVAADHMYNASRRFVAGQADHVVCNTRSAARYIGALAPGAEVSYIPNPVRAVDADPLDWPSPTILSVGRLSAQKDHQTLLEAFAAASLDSWRLAIVGDGGLEERLRRSADRLGIASRVDWYGFVRDPFPYYRSARIFVLPSRFEGMSNALMEAMSFSLPCIVSDGSEGMSELVEDGETGIVFPVGDAAALSRALVGLAGDARLRSRLGANAGRAIGQYSVENALACWDRVLAPRNDGRLAAAGQGRS